MSSSLNWPAASNFEAQSLKVGICRGLKQVPLDVHFQLASNPEDPLKGRVDLF